MKKKKAVSVLLGILVVSTLFAGTVTDTRCPTSCSDYCAVATGTVLFGCTGWGDGFSSKTRATARVKVWCGEDSPIVTTDEQTVYCHERFFPLPPLGGGGDECNDCNIGECPASCPGPTL